MRSRAKATPCAGPAHACRGRSTGRRAALFAVVCLALLLGLAPAARAHQSSVAYLEVAVRGRVVEATVQISNGDLYEALGLGQDRPVTREEVIGGEARLSAYLLGHVRVTNHDLPCPGLAERPGLVDKTAGFFVVQRLRYECPRSAEDLAITYDLFFDLDPRHQGLCHVDAFGAQTEHVFGERSRTLRLSHPLTVWDNARDYLGLGIEHIFTGYDHLAFLFCLLVIAGGMAPGGRAQRLAEDGLRPGGGLRYVLGVVSAFTLAHSVTLIGSALGLVSLPSGPVEALIAASIGYVAAENLLRPRPRHRFLLTFAFGLVHGFGFASVLREIGLPRQGLLLSLLSFNVGVEVGQLLVVLLVLPLLYLLRSHDPPAGAPGPPRRYRARELLGVAGLAALAVALFSRFHLPWAPLLGATVVAPAVLLLLVPRRGYDRCVRRGGSWVLLAFALLWLVERLSGTVVLGGVLG